MLLVLFIEHYVAAISCSKRFTIIELEQPAECAKPNSLTA